MQHIRIRHILFGMLTMLLFFPGKFFAQDNIGIGTMKPHPSVVLEVKDSSRGVLIPRTDTISVLNYVNTLNPNPGIADGLMIFDTLLNTYVYYDADKDDWKILLDLVGPRGPRGFRGPRGPQGDTGLVNDWRDSSGFDQKVLAKDTCGDWFFNSQTGEIWRLWCDTVGGAPRRWVDTILWDKPVGNMTAPDERVFAVNMHASGIIQESMANDTAIVDMVDVPGCSFQVTVQPDEIAYVWAAAHGTTSKLNSNTNYISYAQYELDMGNTGDFYRSSNMQHITTVGPHGPPANTGQGVFAGWYLSGFMILEGDLTDPIDCRCGTPYQKPSCPCSYNSRSSTITLKAGNRYSGSASSSILILADKFIKENPAHMNVFVIIRRNPHALPRKQ